MHTERNHERLKINPMAPILNDAKCTKADNGIPY